MRVDIDVRGGTPAVDEQAVQKLAAFALSHMGVPDAAELSVSVVDPHEIQELNAAWRGRDTTTDVLSFPCDGGFAPSGADTSMLPDMDASTPAGADVFTFTLSLPADDAVAGGEGVDGPGGGSAAASVVPLELGDVVICPDVIDEQRAAFSTSFDEELSLMLVHSVLHLLGYDHETPAGRAAMEQREKEILDAYGLPGLR